MKKFHYASLGFSILFAVLCREFYKNDYSYLAQLFLVLVSSFYFGPLLYFFSCSVDNYDSFKVSGAKVRWCLLALHTPYFIGLLANEKMCQEPGINLVFVFAWFGLAAFTRMFQSVKNFLILSLILCIWFAFEWDLFVLWKGSLYFLNVLMAINLVILLFPIFIGIRPFDLQFKFNYLWSKPLHVYSSLFLLIAVPYGMASGFLQVKEKIEIAQIPVQFLAIFFFNALPEEVLFRGLLQKHMEQYMNQYASLFLVSFVFGIAHLNNFPSWDYRFVIISFMAGLCFGMVYIKTKSMIPAALMHTLVNTTNEVVFDKVPLI